MGLWGCRATEIVGKVYCEGGGEIHGVAVLGMVTEWRVSRTLEENF